MDEAQPMWGDATNLIEEGFSLTSSTKTLRPTRSASNICRYITCSISPVPHVTVRTINQYLSLLSSVIQQYHSYLQLTARAYYIR